MKVILLTILALGLKTSFSQKNQDSIVIKKSFNQGEYDYTFNKDSILALYADSIEHITSVNNLPLFLLKKCFDESLPFLMPYHYGGDIRWELIQKVKNKQVIEIILSCNDFRLKAICKKKYKKAGFVSKYAKYSFYELFKIRYQTFL